MIGWIDGELCNRRPLRIVCAIILLPLVSIAAYGLGAFSGSANAYIAVSGATDRFLDAAVKQLDAQHESGVHQELRTLTVEINKTYEGGFVVNRLNDATARLTSP